MTAAVELGFAQARIQARLGLLPSDADWQRLSACRTLASFLEDARSGALRTWVKGFSAQSQSADIEIGVRRLLSEQVREVSGWAPKRWRDAIDWVAWLPLLPLFQHLARGGSLPDWAKDDRQLAACLDDASQPDARLAERTGISMLLSPDQAEGVGDAWLQAWRGRWPAMATGSRMRLELVVDSVKAHRQVFQSARPEDAWGVRQRLREQLRRQVHKDLLEPAGLFAYLGLTFLDLERLRGELLRRALFAEP